MWTYTPGPWVCDGTKVLIPTGAFCGVPSGVPMDVSKYSGDNPDGDAVLISSAPDLLEALVRVAAAHTEHIAALSELDNVPRLHMAVLEEAAAHANAIELLNRLSGSLRIPGIASEVGICA